jgi:hypothetical protein
MFKTGDNVSWSSQANGSPKIKTGEVVFVLPARSTPYRFVNELKSKFNCAAVDARTLSRDHESYLVAVPARKKGKPRLYWPRVNGLIKA